MNTTEIDTSKLHNGIAHSILQFKGSKPMTNLQREIKRSVYRDLLDRAKQVTAHKSGWVAMIEWMNDEDSETAQEINDDFFISSPCPPHMISHALEAIFAD